MSTKQGLLSPQHRCQHIAAMPRLSLTLSALLAVANGLTLHDQIAAVPNGWSKSSTPSPDQSMTLQIALVKQNLDQLEAQWLAGQGAPELK